MKKRYDNLIQCSDHKWAPFCIVCNHIFNATAKECFRLSGEGSRQDDWLCPDCFRKGPHNLKETDLHAVCIHCARKLVNEMTKYEPPDDLKA